MNGCQTGAATWLASAPTGIGEESALPNQKAVARAGVKPTVQPSL